MAGDLQPLDQKFPVVNPDGSPTDYFTRWAQQRQLDIVSSLDKGGDTMTGSLTIEGVANPLILTNKGICEATITGQGRSRFIVTRYSSDAFSNSNLVQKARGTIAAPSAVLTNDAVGLCEAQAYGGAGFLPVAKIQSFVVAAVPSATNMESELSLEVVPAGSITSTQIALFRYATGLTMYGSNVVIDQNSLVNLRNYPTASLPTPGVTGRLAYNSTTNSPVYDNGSAWTAFAGSGAGGSTPTIRAITACQSSSWSTFNVPFPAGTAVGDIVVVFQENGFGPSTVPTGWVQLANLNNGFTNGYTIAKVMVAADITVGHVTVTAAGAYNGVTCAVCITGSSVTSLDQSASFGSSSSTSFASAAITGLAGSAPTDLVFGFIASRGAMNIAVSSGLTILSTVNGANASGVLVQGSAAAMGLGLSEAATFPVANNGYIWSVHSFK